jgi:hypothetical protein
MQRYLGITQSNPNICISKSILSLLLENVILCKGINKLLPLCTYRSQYRKGYAKYAEESEEKFDTSMNT